MNYIKIVRLRIPYVKEIIESVVIQFNLRNSGIWCKRGNGLRHKTMKNVNSIERAELIAPNQARK